MAGGDMAEPLKRRGEWWQEKADGSWLKWNQADSAWEPQDMPPPPPDEEVAATAPAESTTTGATPGYKYEQATDGTWWARNERTRQLFWHDNRTQEWNPYVPPEPTVQEHRVAAPIYAGFWERFGAALIDAFVVWGAFAVVGALFIPLASNNPGGEGVIAVFAIGYVVAPWLYSALFESSERQATLGKMAVGLRVTDEAGRRISFGKATGRHFGKLISSLILFIGYLMVAWTTRKQALHDQMAGTLVLKRG